MRFLTDDDALAWAQDQGYSPSSSGLPGVAGSRFPQLRVKVPGEVGVLLSFCRMRSRFLSPRSSCLLWVVTWDVWSTSENWHLYYRLRQSYHDHLLLQEAPAHLFLDYEEADLISYLELAILFGWDAEVLPDLSYGGAETARAFISHDGWVGFSHRDAETVSEWKRELKEAGHVILSDVADRKASGG